MKIFRGFFIAFAMTDAPCLAARGIWHECRFAQFILSTMVAMPWPTPMHMVARP
jgi:hypothetical protein